MIAVVIPTTRPESYATFIEAWTPLFEKHRVIIFKILDGEKPVLEVGSPYTINPERCFIEDVMGSYSNLILNKTPAVRNLGFAYIAKHMPSIDYIITLDDDVLPCGDTIQDHIDALNKRVPISWMNTFVSNDLHPRGFPKELRGEAEVVLSHGIWHGVKDWDAMTQLVLGNPDVEFYKGAVPKGVEFAICGMNIAFKRKVLPYVYYAPVAREPGVERFDDIFWGRHFKQEIDCRGWGMVTGYAAVHHNRASDPYKNLVREAVGVGWNENYWERQDEPFFKMYAEKRQRWQEFIG